MNIVQYLVERLVAVEPGAKATECPEARSRLKTPESKECISPNCKTAFSKRDPEELHVKTLMSVMTLTRLPALCYRGCGISD